MSVLLLLLSLTQATTVDQGISLYLSGDMNASISAFEQLLDAGDLSLDEKIRAYHRLGAAYFGIGEAEKARAAFLQLLMLDPYYALGLWENPRLGQILAMVREESMATVHVRGEPEGSLVFIDDRFIGTTPVIQQNLIGGRTYAFTILADGYEPVNQVYTTVPGQFQTLLFTMIPVTEATDASGEPPQNIAMTGRGAEAVGGSQLPLHETRAGADRERPDDVETGAMRPDRPVLPDALPQQQEPVSPRLTPEELMELLMGGTEMTYLGDVGPITSTAPPQVESNEINIRRDPALLFTSNPGYIEPDAENRSRMIFAEIQVDSWDTQNVSGAATYSSRTSDEIRQVLSKKEGPVTFIYNKYLRTDPILSGTVVLEIKIEPSGRVSNVVIVESSTFNPAFDLELATAVETWRFGAVDANEGPLIVQYPFSFTR